MKMKNGILIGDGKRFELGDKVRVEGVCRRSYVGKSDDGMVKNALLFDIIKPRHGIVVGFRINALEWEHPNLGSWIAFTQSKIIKKSYVLYVCFYPNQKPVKVPPPCASIVSDKDFKMERGVGLAKAMKKVYRENPEYFPRDAKGRFV